MGRRAVLRRWCKYIDKRFGIGQRAGRVREQRTKPRIPAARVLQAALVMFAARLGSLNALEQGEPTRWARQWLGGDLPSADTMGRVAAGLALDDLRGWLREHYRRRKRMKTLKSVWGGTFFLILDGHEASASYRRCCPQCCTRTIETKQGPRTQYYHRYVAATLLHADGVLALDLEPQRPGEDEIAAAHARWHIENSLFNELCTRWHADHLCKHKPNAIIAFLLLLFLAFNLVYVFLQRNLKPQLRSGRTTGYWLANITAAFYTDFCRHPP